MAIKQVATVPSSIPDSCITPVTEQFSVASRNQQEVPAERTSPPTPKIKTPPPPLPPRSKNLTIPDRPIYRSLPELNLHPGVQIHLPSHPPTSPVQAQLCTGSGPYTPLGSPCQVTGIQYSVISCPYSSAITQPVAVPAGVRQGEDSAPLSLSWDNYAESPVFSLEGTHLEKAHRKIEIVSTDYSDPESLHGSIHIGGRRPSQNLQQEGWEFNLDSVFEEEAPELNLVADIFSSVAPEEFSDKGMAQQIASELTRMLQEILDEMDDLPAEDIDAGIVNQAEKDRDRIWAKKNAFRQQVRSFVAEYSSSVPGLKEKWEESLTDLLSKVNSYRKEVTTKLEQLRPTVRMSEFEQKSLELQERALIEKIEKRNNREKMLLDEGLAQAKAKLMAFQEDCSNLSAEMSTDCTPYKDRDDVSIANTMQDLKEWKKLYARMSSNYREYERLARVHGEQELLGDDQQSEMEVAEEMFESMKETFEKDKQEIEELDTSRELFSNHKTVGEKLEYPKFSGASNEDYTKFYDKTIKAFRHNKVGRADQVERLRKNLSGFALGLVPESTESIEKAFVTLKAAFGDPKKVLEDRMRKLKLVGDLPGNKLTNNKNGFRKQEEWYLTIEGILHDIIELGKRDEDLAYEAFSESTFNFVLSLFPISMVDKLEEVQGNRKQKLEAVLTKLATFRDKARRLGKVYGDKVPPGASSGILSGGEKTGATVKQHDKQIEKHTAQPGTLYKSAKKYSECKICKQLESEGTTSNLYDNHLSTFPTGCPNFITMKMFTRRLTAIKAKFCIWCLDPDVTFDTSHRDNCKVGTNKITGFSC